MKKILLIVCGCLILGLGILLATNKTFFRDSYEVTNEQGEGASYMTLDFSFYAGEPQENTAVFYRMGEKDSMQERLDTYVEGLVSCYDDGAFCDTTQGISIYSYQVSDGFLIHRITLTYDPVNLKAKEDAGGADRVTFILGEGEIILTQGDSLTVSARQGQPATLLNQTPYEEAATTKNGISLGATLPEVKDAFQLEEGGYLWEKSQETGEVELSIAYRREEGQWILMTRDEMEDTMVALDDGEPAMPYDPALIYRFSFTGGEASDELTQGELVSYQVFYRVMQ